MDAPRYATTARHWAYPWGMGASLGAGFVGLYYLAYYFWGWPWDVRAAGALWFAFVGVYPFLHDGAGALGLFIGGVARGFLAADDDQAGDEGAPGPGESSRSQSPLVGGYQLDEAEQYEYEGLLRLFQHAAAAGSLTSGALIPAAFDNWGHWGYWTDRAVKSGLCVKANGVETTLPAGRTYPWAVGEIRKGNLIWRTADDPAPQPLPHPFSAGLTYKVKAQKAGKGAEKVGKVDEDD